MRIGLCLPQHRDMDLPVDIAEVATTAEAQGFDSLWVYERLAFPTKKHQDMYDIPGLEWEGAYVHTADPLTVLAVAAAVTSRVRLGSSVLVAGLHRPVQLAKSLATIDRIAGGGGRVIAGLGVGWMFDEYEAVDAQRRHRARDLEETIAVLRAAWAEDPVSHKGPLSKLDEVLLGPKPTSPIALMLGGGFAEPAVRRIAIHADGWPPSNRSGADTMDLSRRIAAIAAEHGRDHLEVINRANIQLTEQWLGRAVRPGSAASTRSCQTSTSRLRPGSRS
jgi:probable F420-dependent oxidoreductase